MRKENLNLDSYTFSNGEKIEIFDKTINYCIMEDGDYHVGSDTNYIYIDKPVVDFCNEHTQFRSIKYDEMVNYKSYYININKVIKYDTSTAAETECVRTVYVYKSPANRVYIVLEAFDIDNVSLYSIVSSFAFKVANYQYVNLAILNIAIQDFLHGTEYYFPFNNDAKYATSKITLNQNAAFIYTIQVGPSDETTPYSFSNGDTNYLRKSTNSAGTNAYYMISTPPTPPHPPSGEFDNLKIALLNDSWDC